MDHLEGAITAVAQLLSLLCSKLRPGRRSSDASISVVDSDTSLPLPTGEYDVFLNFRGPDTRYQITDILHRFLGYLRVQTFLDDENLRKGEGIWPNLVKAIEQSKIYVPIFSKDYATSKWCLKELAAIVERQKQEQGCIILPIFYMVKPNDVRNQTDTYKKAFQKHTRNFDEKTVQEWRDALSTVGALKGWHIQSNDKQAAVADIVTSEIWSHLSKSRYIEEADKLVAIDDHIEAVKEMIKLDSTSVGVVGIHGIGGIGKTTIAKAVFNKISASFGRCSFVSDVRETLKQSDGIINLQKKIILDIMRLNSVDPITSANDGIKIIRERVSGFKVLIVLDDVDDKSKLQEIIGNFENFTCESRFIITSRDVKVLSTLTEDNKLYGVRGMNHTHSLQLFCKHAFNMDFPLPGYETLSMDVVSTMGGLPLTLKVVGSLLYKQDEGFWKEKLAQFRQHALEEEVREVLMISYTSLSYEAKQIFLDIACFFIGEDKEMASYMWADCGFYPISNIIILIQRSLIEIGNNNRLQMHDQLRDLGIDIVHRDNIEEPLRSKSRIWSNQQALELLNGEKGPSKVQAIRVHSPAYIREEIKSECFMNLSELRYFESENIKLIGDFSNLLPNMRWLRLHHNQQPGDELNNLKMKNLTILDLHISAVADDWGGWSHIKMTNKLKVVKLDICSQLTRLPHFPSSLEILNLSRLRLTAADLDIGNLSNLKVLTLFRSTGVRKITGGSIGVLKQLRELDVTEFSCANLGEFMADIGELQALKQLRARGTHIGTTRDVGIRLPKSLKELETSSPVANLSELLELEKLEVLNCDYGLEIPPADTMWRNLSKLKSLFLRGTKIIIAGPAISPPPSLLLPSSLTRLRIDFSELEWIPNLGNLESLTGLFISCCPQLQEIQGLGGLKSLEDLDIFGGDSLRLPQGLGAVLSFNKLKRLSIRGCPGLTTLSAHDQQLGGGATQLVLDSLQSLSISGSALLLQTNFGQMLHLSKFPRLMQLELEQKGANDGDKELLLEGLESLEELTQLRLIGLTLHKLPSLSKLRKLEDLFVIHASNLREIEGLPDLKSLEMLTLRGCTSFERLPEGLSGLKRLHMVDIRGFGNMTTDLSALSYLPPISGFLRGRSVFVLFKYASFQSP